MRKEGHGWVVTFINEAYEQMTIEYSDKDYMMQHLADDIERSPQPDDAFIIPPGNGFKAVDFLEVERKKENYFKEKYNNLFGNYLVGLDKFPINFKIGDLHQSDYVETGNIADYQGFLNLGFKGVLPVWTAVEYKKEKSGIEGSFLKSITFEDYQQNIFYENENLMSAFMLEILGIVVNVVDIILYEDELLNENEREIYYSFGFCPRLK
jgi:hypothetical protein